MQYSTESTYKISGNTTNNLFMGKTRLVCNYMATKCSKLGINHYKLGNVEMVITDSLTYIKCCETGDLIPIFYLSYDFDKHDNYYYSGTGITTYSNGNIVIGYNAKGKLIAISKKAMYNLDISLCEMCNTFSRDRQLSYNAPRIISNIKEWERTDSYNRRTIYYYDEETGSYSYLHNLCQNCCDKYSWGENEENVTYARCERCGIIFPENMLSHCSDEWDEDLYCDECLEEREAEIEAEIEAENSREYDENEGEWEDLNCEFINDYHDGNHAQRALGSKQMFGAEYEILCFDNDNLEDYDDRWSFCNNLSKYGAITKDGSVDLEIVTEPMTLSNLRTNILNIAKVCRAKYVRAWDGNKCGLHIHLNRGGLTNLAGIYRFLSDNKDELFTLSGRTKDHCGYCKFIFPASDEDLEEACDKYDRYLAINLQNSKTVEFRFFRNTTNETRLNAYFDFLETLMRLQDDIIDYDWDSFIKETHNEFLYKMFDIEEEPLAEVA